MAVVVVATLAVSGVALAKNIKFTFEDVTLEDGDLVVENGVVEAASKENKKAEFVSCSYYTEAYVEYLGQYADDTSFADSKDLEADVEEFCVEHFPDRVE